MTTLSHRSYRADVDLPAMIDVLLACRGRGRIDKWPTVSELRLVCNPARADWERRPWVDGAGALGGFALANWSCGAIYFFVAPRHEGSGLEDQIVAWALEKRARDAGGGATLRCSVREDNVRRIECLERHGFARDERYTVRYVRPLDEPISEPRLPPGFTIRPVAGECEAEACAALHRDAFGTEGMTADARLTLMRQPAYVPELDLAAVAPGGTLAAFCVGGIDREENAASGRKEGWTDPVGTRPAFRRRGLARAVILAALCGLRERGMESAIIGAGSWNAAARGAYESVGFRELYRVAWYIRDLG